MVRGRKRRPASARDFGTLASLDQSALEHFASGRVVIPTLEEDIVFTKRHDWLVNVEIKSFPERPRDSVEPILNVIAATETASQVLISSFDHRDVAAANRPGRLYGLAILAMTPLFQVEHRARNRRCRHRSLLGGYSRVRDRQLPKPPFASVT